MCVCVYIYNIYNTLNIQNLHIYIYIYGQILNVLRQPRNSEVSTGTYVYILQVIQTRPKLTLCRRLSFPTIQILSSPETFFKICLLCGFLIFLNPAHPPSSLKHDFCFTTTLRIYYLLKCRTLFLKPSLLLT